MGRGGRQSGWGGSDAGYDEWATRRLKEDRAKNEKVVGRWVVIITHKTGKMKSEEMSYADAVSYINNKSKRDIHIAATSRLGQFMPTYSIEIVKGV